MAKYESLNFFDEINELLDPEGFRPFTIVLSSGARYLVGQVDELVIYTSMFTYLPPKGSVVMFPRSQVSSVEIDF